MVCEVHFNKSLTKERKRNTHIHNLAREWPRRSWQGALTPQGASQRQGVFTASVTRGWPGVTSLLQAWDGGRQVSAGLRGFLKVEAGLEDGTVWAWVGSWGHWGL